MIWLSPVLALLCASGIILNLSLSSLAKEELEKKGVKPGFVTKILASKWDKYEEIFDSLRMELYCNAYQFFGNSALRITRLVAAILIFVAVYWVGSFLIEIILRLF